MPGFEHIGTRIERTFTQSVRQRRHSPFWKIRPKGGIEVARKLSGYGWLGGRGLCEQLGDALGELSAVAGPVGDAVALEVDGRGVGAGVVGPDDFDGTAIAGAILFNDNDTVVGLLGGSNAGETDHQHLGITFQNSFYQGLRLVAADCSGCLNVESFPGSPLQ